MCKFYFCCKHLLFVLTIQFVLLVATAQSPVILKDIYAGVLSSNPGSLTLYNGALYFQATNAANGAELWKTDGTEAGTVMLKDINAGTASSSPTEFIEYNGLLYFRATTSATGAELWKTDGTAAGTVLAANINTTAGESSTPTQFAVFNGSLYFRATTGASGSELWRYNGTTASKITELMSGASGSAPAYLTVYNNALYFYARSNANGYEVFKYTGSGSATLLKEIYTGTGSSSPSNFKVYNGKLYFRARSASSTNYELWSTNGTSAGTAIVKEINSGTTAGSTPSELIVFNNLLFFRATTAANGVELWKSNGTSAGTAIVKDIRSGTSSSTPAGFTIYNNSLYFSATNGTNGIELWKTDGTSAGTVMVKDINSGSGSSSPTHIRNINNFLYFQATTSTTGAELWKSDGTDAGTSMIADIIPGTAGSKPLNFALLNYGLVFKDSTAANGYELFRLQLPAPPVTFSVTGGGSYCAGGEGLNVGLSSSETNTTYQLLLYGNSVGAPVTGTGSAISFGNQLTTGTYTVLAKNSIGNTFMTGSAVIAVNPVPVTHMSSSVAYVGASNVVPFYNQGSYKLELTNLPRRATTSGILKIFYSGNHKTISHQFSYKYWCGTYSCGGYYCSWGDWHSYSCDEYCTYSYTNYYYGTSRFINENNNLLYTWQNNNVNCSNGTETIIIPMDQLQSMINDGSFTVNHFVEYGAGTCSNNSVYFTLEYEYGPDICLNASPLTLNLLPAGGTLSGPGLVGNTFDPSVAGLGLHDVSYSYTNSFGCTNTTTVPINVVNSFTYFPDADGDGYGSFDTELSIESCSPIEGYVSSNTDCDDSNANINPGQTEICNGIDDDCNGLVDDGEQGNTYYLDADNDGHGSSTSIIACNAPAGYVNQGDDCDDSDPTTYPGAPELCNGVDDNCDGTIDEGLTQTLFFKDSDGDGYGSNTNVILACSPPEGYITVRGDCDDNNPSINPSVPELCNGIDDDCNEVTDENLPLNTYYQDNDGDSFGSAVSIMSCSMPEGYAEVSGDCNDNNPNINPGAREICGNGIDDDCNGQQDEGAPFYRDLDGDRYGSSTLIMACSAPAGYVDINGDCNDNNAAVNPEAEEVCNGIDDDCDGEIDEDLDSETYYQDNDNDGFGNPSVSITTCSKPVGYVTEAGDCNDADPTINPDVTETCNNKDDNCDGSIDENLLPTINDIPDVNVCAGTQTSAINFSGSLPGLNYTWTNNNPSIGLVASGSGNINPFAAINNTGVSVTATVAVTPNSGAFAYIPNFNTNTVSVINLASNSVVSTIPAGIGPWGVSVSPDDSKVYISNYSSNNVSVISTTTNTVIATIPVGTQPRGLCVTPDGTKLYVGNTISNTVSVINTLTNTVIATVAIGGSVAGSLSVSPDGSKVYVVNSSFSNVSVINTSTNAVIATIPVGTSPQGIAISADGTRVYVANLSSNNISVINTVSNLVIATIPVGSTPVRAAISADGTKLYVVNNGSHNLSVISTATNSLITTISVGINPYGISISSDGMRIYVTNVNSNSVSVINSSTNSILTTIPSVSQPYALGNFLTNNGCIGQQQTFTITVNSTPQPTASTTQSFCSLANKTVNDLIASGQNRKWYNAASGGTQYTGTELLVTGNYYVTQTINGCESARKQVSVTITPTVPTPSINFYVTTICQGGSTILTVSPVPNSSGYQWFRNGSGVGVGSSYTATQAGSYTVKANANSGYCASSISNAVTITVDPLPVAPNAENQSFCSIDLPTVSNLAAAGSNLKWYNSSMQLLSLNQTLSTGTYYLTQTVNNCEGPSTSVSVIVTQASVFYQDADEDEYGDPETMISLCTETAPAGYVSNNDDCNDANASVHPNATEICNGLDDDCDGLTDEGFINTQINCPVSGTSARYGCTYTVEGNEFDAIVTQNCGPLSYTLSGASTGTGSSLSGVTLNHGSTLITWSAINATGQIFTCNFRVTVIDNQPPSIICPSNISATATSAAGALINYIVPVGTDNCGIVMTERISGLASGSTFSIGTTVVSYKVTDAAGNIATCSFNVNVSGLAPSIQCPSNINVNTVNGGCSAEVNFAATETVGIPASIITYSHAAGSSFPIGTTTVTATAINAVGTSTCTFTVTVIDNQDPTITAPANVSVNADNGSCSATSVVLGSSVTNDNCGVASVTNDHPSTTYPVGTTTVTWTVTDVNGNTSTATQTVTVTDNQNPTITAPVNVSVKADNGSCSATNVALGSPVTNDNCGVASVTNDHPSTTYPVRTTTVTWTVTDVNGNINTATQTVTVIDNQDPTITAPANVSVNADNGSCLATNVVLGSPATNDNCGVASVTNNHLSSTYPVGTTTVIWTVTDVNGNINTATQTVAVIDDQDPTITAPANVSVNADNGSCSATNVVLGSSLTNDNCGVASVTNNHLSSTYPVGTTTVTWTVTDVNGNINTATQIVTVTDDEDPTITAPANVSVNANAGICSATNVLIGSPVTGDNCGVASVTNDHPSSTYPVGTTTVTWTVTDVNGSISTATQTVTVTDNQNPTINAPANVSVNADNGSCLATNVVLGSPATNDNCGVASVTNNHLSSTYPVGTTTVIWTVTDVNGNINTATQTVTVTDDQNPTITAPANVTVNADNGSCLATSIVLGSPVTNDNCGVASVSNNHSSSTYPVGTTTVTWTVTDVNGKISTATQTVTVTDNQDPTITAPANVSVNADNGSCSATSVALGSPVTSDNCGVASVTNDHPSTTYPVGTTTVTWTVTDVNGNINTATHTVTITDDQNPTITAPAKVSVNADNGSCLATNVVLGSPVTNDNCGVASVTNDHPSTTYPVGTTTVTWTVTDVNGYISTATQTVTVTDDEDPTITAPANVSVNANAGICSATNVSIGSPVTNDNCGVASVTNNHLFSTYPVGTTTVIWTVTDVNGNISTVTQTVTVIDNQDPTITAPANVSVNADNGSCSATLVVLGSPVTNDNCGIASVTNNRPSSTYPVGTTTVTWTVTDVNGNINTATQTVAVTDDQDPTITAPANVSVNANAGICSATNVVLGSPVTNDNCGVANVTNDHPSSTYPVGTTTVTWIVTDVNGKSSTATQTVTVTDNQNPSITAPTNVSVNANAGICSATNVVLGSPITNDNCGVASVTNNHPSSTYPVGTTTVTWTVTDVNGNTSTATQIVTVLDAELPHVITGNITRQFSQSGTVTISASDINNGSWDNCGINISSINVSPSTFNCTNVGDNTVTLSITDIHGNTNTATAIVHIDPLTTVSYVTTTTPRQYSDEITFNAEIAPGSVTGGCNAASSVTFKIDNRVMGTASLIWDANTNKMKGTFVTTLFELANSFSVAPGQKNVTAIFNGVNPAFIVPNATTTLTVTAENARAEYTGSQFVSTPNIAITDQVSVIVPLRMNVQDISFPVSPVDPLADPYAGNISRAKARFIVRETGSPIVVANFTDANGWIPISLLSTTDSSTGTVALDWLVTLSSNQYSYSPTIDIEVGGPNGYYTRNNPDDKTVVTISRPSMDFVTGGGVVMPGTSSGQYAPTTGKKINFGFNLKYNKSGKNLQGNVNIVYRRVINNETRIFQIKGNSMIAMGVNTANPLSKLANFTCKATLNDVTDPLNIIAYGGSHTLELKMTDNGEPGHLDSIAVTLYKSDGTLLMSSNWIGITTKEKKIANGNIVISGGSIVTRISSDAITVEKFTPILQKGVLTNLSAIASPNPTDNFFTLTIKSKSQQPVTIRILDVSGKQLEVMRIPSPGYLVRFGHQYIPGFYFAEIIQEHQRINIKLIKGKLN